MYMGPKGNILKVSFFLFSSFCSSGMNNWFAVDWAAPFSALSPHFFMVEGIVRFQCGLDFLEMWCCCRMVVCCWHLWLWSGISERKDKWKSLSKHVLSVSSSSLWCWWHTSLPCKNWERWHWCTVFQMRESLDWKRWTLPKVKWSQRKQKWTVPHTINDPITMHGQLWLQTSCCSQHNCQSWCRDSVMASHSRDSFL